MSEPLFLADQEYLTFVLGKEEFGVDILRVQEIRVWSPVTEIPSTPEYLKGVINLRGTIVPIIDLRQRFDCEAEEYSATTVVIVLQGQVNNQQTMVGIVVDAVSDVHKVNSSDVKEPPNFGSHIDSRFISGMATVGEKIIILLDSIKLLDVEHLFHNPSKEIINDA